MAKIDLRNFIAIHVTGVLDPDAHVEAAVELGRTLKRGVVERGVAQPMAEGEQRLDLLLVEPAVAHVHAFAVGGLVVDAFGRALRVSGIGGRVVLRALCPR